MKILITGASGFLGRNLISKLLKENHAIIALKRSFSICDNHDGVVYYDVDKYSLEEIFKVEKNIEAVIHTATSYGRNNETLEEIVQSNVLFPLKILTLATENNVKIFINTDTFWHKFTNEYSISKKHLTDWLIYYSKNNKIKAVNIILGHLYGPGDSDHKFVTSMIKKMISGEEKLDLTHGDQIRDFLFIEDAVTAYCMILNEIFIQKVQNYEEIELGSGVGTTIKTIVEEIKKATNANTRLNFGNIPYRKNELMCSISNTTKLRGLGWDPKISLIEGIKITVDQTKDLL